MAGRADGRKKRRQAELEELLVKVSRFGLVGRLTASVAHELLQPLTAIVGNAEASLRRIDAAPTAIQDLAPLLQDIIESGCLASTLINRLRGLLREEPQEPQPVDLNQLVLEAASLLAGELRARRVSLVTRLDSLPKLTSTRPVGLQRVVVSLLMRGADALQDSSGEREIVVTTRCVRKQLELTVSLTRRGLGAATAQDSFQPSFHDLTEGFGAGLTMYADIVRPHGGRLRATGSPRGATMFHLSLPLDQRPRGRSDHIRPAA
jgi:C4-dicarboxylate-specific signal transduction histidine kinase